MNNPHWGQRADLAALSRESDSKPSLAAYVILSARYKLPTQSPWGRYAAAAVAIRVCARDVSYHPHYHNILAVDVAIRACVRDVSIILTAML